MLSAAPMKTYYFLIPVGKGWGSAKLIQAWLRGREILQNSEDACLVPTALPQQFPRILSVIESTPEFPTKKGWKILAAKSDYFLTGIFKEKGGILSKINKKQIQSPACGYLSSFLDHRLFCFTAMEILLFPWKMTKRFICGWNGCPWINPLILSVRTWQQVREKREKKKGSRLKNHRWPLLPVQTQWGQQSKHHDRWSQSKPRAGGANMCWVVDV